MKQRMVGVIRPFCNEREHRRSRASPQPLLLLLLPLMLALLSVTFSQSTTQLRRSCLAGSAATLCCISSSCDEGSTARLQLAGAVSALRESEARFTQLKLNLTATADRYRAATVATRSSELAADAARNACDALALELRASDYAVDRLAANASLDFRRAADERAALRRRADGAEELLRVYDAGLRAVERTLSEMRSELNATISSITTMQSETTRNLSSLSDFVGSALLYIDIKTNTSSDYIMELFKIVTQQEFAINILNQTQQYSEAKLNYQASVLNARLNSSVRQRVIDMDTLRLSTLSRSASLENRLNTIGNQLNKSVERLSVSLDSLNDSLEAIGPAVRLDLQRATNRTEATLIVNERQRAADLDDLRVSSLSRFVLIEDRLNSTGKQLNDSNERLTLRCDSLNNSLMSLGAAVRGDVERAAVMAESTLLGVKSEVASNLSLLAETVASLNFSKQTEMSRISELFAIVDQQKFLLSHLNRTQQESDVSCKRQTLALSSELNLTKLNLERLREEFGKLRDENERLIADARNLSALLGGCPSGWQRNGSRCYLLVTGWSGSWSESRGRCNMMSADLVTVPSAAVNAFLSSYMVNNSGVRSAWLGATDVDQEGSWRWVTGEVFFSGLQRRSYSNFAVGEPANVYFGRTENCLTMNRQGSWNDTYCSLAFPFFCQIYRP